MKVKKLIGQLNRSAAKLTAALVGLLITFLLILPAGNRIEERFASLGISPGDDIPAMMSILNKKLGPAKLPDPALPHNLRKEMTLRDMRLLIDNIQLSLTTGFKFSVSELDDEQREGFTVKNFQVKGKASFLGISGFISSIESHPLFMRFKSGSIRYYGVLEGSVAFVDYEVVISVPIQPAEWVLRSPLRSRRKRRFPQALRNILYCLI